MYHASQITNAQIEEHFELKVIDTIYAEDSKGRRQFLSDLRTKLARELTNKAKQKSSNKTKNEQRKSLVEEKVQDFFVELDRAFPDNNVLIRETQPGVDERETLGLNIHCMVSAWGGHRLSITSKIFDRADLEKDFEHYSIFKNTEDKKNEICLGRLTTDDMIEIVRKAIQLHEAAAE